LTSLCAVVDALETHAFWHVVSPEAHALMQVRMPMQAESLAQVWVTLQQLVLTQLAQLAALKLTPQAIVPTPPELLPLPPPLEPPLEPPLLLPLHWLAQLADSQESIELPALVHAELPVAFCWHVDDMSAEAL
jgi:hypothetical protein